MATHNYENTRVGGRFTLQKKIGEGAFGEIYIASSIDTGDRVAVKLVGYISHSQLTQEHSKSHRHMLLYEAKVYRGLSGIRSPELETCSRDPLHPVFWHGGRDQCARDGAIGAKLGGPI
jgi:serine/threonine protein kinase